MVGASTGHAVVIKANVSGSKARVGCLNWELCTAAPAEWRGGGPRLSQPDRKTEKKPDGLLLLSRRPLKATGVRTRAPFVSSLISHFNNHAEDHLGVPAS